MTVAVFLILAILAALVATIGASAGWLPLAVGAPGSLAFVALAFAFAAAARGLHAPDTLREPREPRGPTGPVEIPRDGVTRRVFGRLWFIAFGAFALFPFVPLVALRRSVSARSGTGWTKGARVVDPAGRPLRPTDLDVGGVATVFPEGRLDAPETAAMLIRLEPGQAAFDPAKADWSPHDAIAYSKICTHAGCPVALYRRATYQLYCPCHQSIFDVVQGGRRIAGPAPRALPRLPLDVDADGYLVARGDFDGPVGPDDWERPV